MSQKESDVASPAKTPPHTKSFLGESPSVYTASEPEPLIDPSTISNNPYERM